MSHSPVTPQWAIQYAKNAQKYLGIEKWQITVEAREIPNLDNQEADATANCRPAYFLAELYFRPYLIAEDHRAARVLILHELVHVLNAYRDVTINDLIGLSYKPRQQKWAHSLFVTADEQAVTSLSEGLVDIIPFVFSPEDSDVSNSEKSKNNNSSSG